MSKSLFDHPRHADHADVTYISLERLNSAYAHDPVAYREKFQFIVVISCMDVFYNYYYLFGDWIDFDRSGSGLYSRPEFQPAFDAIQHLCDQKHQVFLIAPQPRPDSSFLQQENLHYIEMPEFYGIYQTWFDAGYRDVDIDMPLSRHYNFLNKRNRPARQLLFYFLNRSNLLNRGFVSFLGHGLALDRKFNPGIFHSNHELLQQSYPEFKNFDEILMPDLPYFNSALLTLRDKTMGTGGWLPDHQLYEQSFVSVIGETHDYLDGATIFTEKIFRAIWFGRPFLLIGGQHSLLELKKLGFRTFEDWFDESYDLEPSLFQRVEMIHRELIKISTLNLTECKNILRAMQPILLHNQQNLRRLRDALSNKMKQIDRFILSKNVHRNQKISKLLTKML